MEGEESLLLKLERSANLNPQIKILSPGNRVTLTIKDNDFVTIAPDKLRVAEGNEIVFELTRPGGDLASELDGDGADWRTARSQSRT